jgi:hypothetical protein
VKRVRINRTKIMAFANIVCCHLANISVTISIIRTLSSIRTMCLKKITTSNFLWILRDAWWTHVSQYMMLMSLPLIIELYAPTSTNQKSKPMDKISNFTYTPRICRRVAYHCITKGELGQNSRPPTHTPLHFSTNRHLNLSFTTSKSSKYLHNQQFNSIIFLVSNETP